ncbi:hypothetical protein [Wansuia hejianensis]|uniref:Uncharacterized protein n=1 Tax=Wansuia hejianensis TaxID=2763667 RepID=A0A926ILY2_9FIRM|nr:hypothetical protein [Wansuia hejianensis]MBC8590639.1 hypothetical protein [Wansuia hejianensis]
MTKAQITTAVEEAARLLRENPELTYKEAIDAAKEMIEDDKKRDFKIN